MTDFELDLRIGKLLGKEMLVFRESQQIYAHNSMGFPVEWHPSTSWDQGSYPLNKFHVHLGEMLSLAPPRFVASCRGAQVEGKTYLVAGLLAILAAEDRDNPQTSFTETIHEG